MTYGITARPAEMRLTERAADYLAAGPADVVALIGHICQLPNPPRVVAEHMATALFAGRTEFVREEGGRWALSGWTSAPGPPSGLDARPTAAAAGTYASLPAGAATVDPASPSGAPIPGTVGCPAPRGGAVARPSRLRMIDPLAAPDARRRIGATRADDSVTAPPPEGDAVAAPGLLGPLSPCDAADVLASLSYVVVDVETTGTRPWSGDRITEIAAVVVRDGEIREVFETLVNPQRPIPPMISALTNITWSMVKDAPVFRDICDRVLGVIGGSVFVAHNAAFDWRFVTSEVSRASGQRLSGRQLCTVRLARKLLPHLRSRSLDHVAAYYGVDITARHRAAGDAVATAHVLLGLLRDARERGCESWPALEALIAKRKPRPRRGRPSAMPRSVDRDCGA